MITQTENQKQNEKPKKLDAKNKLADISHLKYLPAAAFDTDSSSERIDKFISKYNDGLIVYPPGIQRRGIWSIVDQQELIESLIKGIPIPPVYINKKYKDGEQVWEVLDGRQRITALIDFFVNNTVTINKNLPEGYEPLEGYTFEEIEANNGGFAARFSSIQFGIVWMDNAPDNLKKEFFQKLNKGGKALTAGELAHSSLAPAKPYMVSLMKTSFYENHVQKTKRYAEYVPASKIIHMIIQSKQKDNTFIYNPLRLNGWKDRINTNPTDIQTDLDNLHEKGNEQFIPYYTAEVERVTKLIDEVLGNLKIEYPNNKLVTNIIIALLILEDDSNPEAMSKEDLKQAFKGLVELWDKGHEPLLRKKLKTELANITREESTIVNECDKLVSASKTSLADVLENLRNDVYSNYI